MIETAAQVPRSLHYHGQPARDCEVEWSCRVGAAMAQWLTLWDHTYTIQTRKSARMQRDAVQACSCCSRCSSFDAPADPVGAYLCQWAPAVCLGFLLFTFGPVGALTSFEFSEPGRPPLNTDGQWNPKPRRLPPRCRRAHSFRILS